ncbi:MAG: hypothetical protein H0W78_10330 [Planctomycetes bacterium]|jgi:hypothetical protein|nr:hypothetical protein [Planctomycetota bacterium]
MPEKTPSEKRTTRSENLEVAAMIVRRTPGALVYQRALLCEESVHTTTQLLGEKKPPVSALRKAYLLVMAQHAKDRPLDVLLERLRQSMLPLIAGGADVEAAKSIQELVAEATQDFPQLHVAAMVIAPSYGFAWIHGRHRILLVRQGRGQVLMSRGKPWCGRVKFAPGDAAIILSPSAVAAVPSELVSLLARTTLGAITKRIAELAVVNEPLSHHAVVALRIPGTTKRTA